MELSRLQEKVLRMLGSMMNEIEDGPSASDEEICVQLVELPCALSILVDRQRAERMKRDSTRTANAQQAESHWQQQVEERIRVLSFSDLEWYVLTKKPHWEYAKRLLRERRANRENVGQMPPPPPIPDRAAPHNPDGSEGDYWRIKGG
jgi:hypothetical protein